MVNTAPLVGLFHNLMLLLALCGGTVWGSAVALPIRKRIIRKYRVPNARRHDAA